MQDFGGAFMKTETIYGVLRYLEKEYPFVLDGRILTIPQYSFQYNQDFCGIENIDCICGETSKNINIYFIKCSILGGKYLEMCPEVRILVSGYVILLPEYDSFNQIQFFSEAINVFYSPRNAYKPNVNFEEKKINGITLYDESLYHKEFNCKINDEDLTIGLNVSVFLNLKLENRSMGTADTIFYINLPEKKSPYDITNYFLYLEDFLSFVNFRKTVPIDRIELFCKSTNDDYKRCGRAVIFQNERKYNPAIYQSITYKDITDDAFPVMFKYVAEKRQKGYFNSFLFPEDEEDNHFIDSYKWLNVATCFEGEFNENFPDYKAEHNDNFAYAKSYLLKAIEDKIKESGLSEGNKKNTPYTRFKTLIEKTDTTIEEKFKICKEKYEYAIEDMITIISQEYGISAETDFAHEYSIYRNQLAHGDVRKPENIDIATYRMLRCFIYIMNLRNGKVPDCSIKAIINKLILSRNI